MEKETKRTTVCKTIFEKSVVEKEEALSMFELLNR